MVVLSFGCDETNGSTSSENGLDGGIIDAGIQMRLFPIEDIADPLASIKDAKNVDDCQIWIDHFLPGEDVAGDRVTLTFDSHGDWVLEELDVGLNGMVDLRRSRVMNADGQPTVLEIDQEGDGFPDERIDFEWDGGVLVSEQHDRNGDSMPDRQRRYQYNSAHRLSVEDWIELPSGRLLESTRYEYDQAGRPIEVSRVTGQEAQLSWRVQSQYDEFGRLSDWQEDEDGDGQFDYRILYTINDETRQVTERHDRESDGRIDGVTNTTFDDRNRPVLRELDDAGDGVVNERVRFEYDGLLLLRRGHDRDLDGREDGRLEYQYDERGRLAEKTVDLDVDDDQQPELWSLSYFCL